MRARDDLIRTNLRMALIELGEVKAPPVQVCDAIRRLEDVLASFDRFAAIQSGIALVPEENLKNILSILIERLEQDDAIPVHLLSLLPKRDQVFTELLWQDSSAIRRISWKFKPSYRRGGAELWGYDVFVSLESDDLQRKYDEHLPFFIPLRSLNSLSSMVEQLIAHVKLFVVNW